eukprot:762781-Hanusia_phi.AAC.26
MLEEGARLQDGSVPVSWPRGREREWVGLRQEGLQKARNSPAAERLNSAIGSSPEDSKALLCDSLCDLLVAVK